MNVTATNDYISNGDEPGGDRRAGRQRDSGFDGDREPGARNACVHGGLRRRYDVPGVRLRVVDGDGRGGTGEPACVSTPPLATLSAAAARGNVVVAIEDAAGDVTTSGAQVTLAVSGPNAYSQTHTAAALNGMALFAFNSALLSAGTGWLHHCTSFPL